VIGENGMISMISTLQGWFAHGMEQPNLDPDYELMSAFELAMKDLLSSIEEQREPLLSGQLAYKTTEIIMAAYESANKQARVDLPLTTKTFPLLSRHAQAKG
jgi:predicted dehydrogenase